jgi:PAS domain-containing protein
MPYRTQDDRIDGVVITFANITVAKTLEGKLREKHTVFGKARVAEDSIGTGGSSKRRAGSEKAKWKIAVTRKPKRPHHAKEAAIIRPAAQLRSRAEARLREQKKLKAGVAKTGADSRRLLHELQVHQIELEMQNAELRQARDELEVALENYTDLYDFAPSGYFTLAATGAILQANLTGATLVGIERSRLVGQSFGRLVSAEFRPAFSTFLEQVFAGQAKQSGDFELAGKGQPLRFVNIEAQCLLNGQECRATVVDITARKVAEAAQCRLEVMTASNRKLEQEIIRRKTLEQALKTQRATITAIVPRNSARAGSGTKAHQPRTA